MSDIERAENAAPRFDGLRLRQRDAVVTKPFAGGCMVVPTLGDDLNSVLSLNAAGAFVWGLLERTRTFGELASLVEKEYGLSPAVARADLSELLESISGWLEIEPDAKGGEAET